MDPVTCYIGRNDSNEQLLKQFLGNIISGGPPVEIWKDGVKVAIAIHPEEFDLLNRLVADHPQTYRGV